MKCENCGIDTGMYALSDKPDPGYGYNTHTWEQCARQLMAEAAGLPTREVGAEPLKDRIKRLLDKRDARWERINEAIRDLQHAVK